MEQRPLNYSFTQRKRGLVRNSCSGAAVRCRPSSSTVINLDCDDELCLIRAERRQQRELFANCSFIFGEFDSHGGGRSLASSCGQFTAWLLQVSVGFVSAGLFAAYLSSVCVRLPDYSSPTMGGEIRGGRALATFCTLVPLIWRTKPPDRRISQHHYRALESSSSFDWLQRLSPMALELFRDSLSQG